MKMKMTSTKLIANLTQLKSEFAGRSITARLSVPPELSWWYFQEFGTASGLGSGEGGFSEGGISMRDIAGAKEGGQWYLIGHERFGFLSWPTEDGGASLPSNRNGDLDGHSHSFNGKNYRFDNVFHPGVTTPLAFVRRALADIQVQSRHLCIQSLHENDYSFDALSETMSNTVMPVVRALIAASMESSGLKNDRTDGGKLAPGESPADLFQSQAYITTLA